MSNPHAPVDELDTGQRDREWFDCEGIRWRWHNGWYWYKDGISTHWVGPSNRGDIIKARGPFTPTRDELGDAEEMWLDQFERYMTD